MLAWARRRWSLGLLTVIATVLSCEALSNNNNPLLSNLWSKVTGATTTGATLPEQRRQRQDPEALLKQLNLEASTEPRLAFARPSQIPTLASSSVVAVLRGASGVFGYNYQLGLTDRDAATYSYLTFGEQQMKESASALTKSPRLPLVLYESESDADSRLVREACSILSLTVTMYPVPRQGTRYRAQAQREFGASVESGLPFLLDPNAKTRMTSSIEIIDYLFSTYGTGDVPWILQQPTTEGGKQVNWPLLSATIGLNARLGAGGRCEDSNFDGASAGNDVPLVLYAYEGSPFCKIVRERLSALELPHTIYFTPRGGPNRQRLYDITGRFQVPYFQDSNTGVEIFESEAIVEYINKQYAA